MQAKRNFREEVKEIFEREYDGCASKSKYEYRELIIKSKRLGTLIGRGWTVHYRQANNGSAPCIRIDNMDEIHIVLKYLK